MYTKPACVVGRSTSSPADAMDSMVTAIGNGRDPDGFRKKYGPKSTDSLTFSIARIMEPDSRKQQQPAITVGTSAPAADYFHALESAFKKYVPAFRSANAADDSDSPARLATPYPMTTSAAAAVQLFHYQRQQSSLPSRSRPPPPPSRTSQPLALRPPSLPVRMPPMPPPPTRPPYSTVSKSADRPPPSNAPPPTPAAAVPPQLPPPPAKTFTCNHCGKVFYAHYNLTRHMPVHTGARPFICKVCTTQTWSN